MFFLLLLQASIAVSFAPPPQPSHSSQGPKVWVFFRDKGVRDQSALANAIVELEKTYPRRAIERRRLRRSLPGLFDERDVRLSPDYIRAVREMGLKIVVESAWLNAISVRAPAEDQTRLAKLPFVRAIQPVRGGKPAEAVPVKSHSAGALVSRGAFYGLSEGQLQQIAVDAMHSAGFTGAGVIIGVLDTGFGRSHVAFNEPGHPLNVIAEWDFINNDGNTDYQPGDPILNTPFGPYYQHYHGTSVLGAIGAYKPGELVGGAYDAAFVLAKTEDISSETPVEEDYYAAGLQFLEMNGADVATSSLAYTAWYDYSDMNGQTAVTTLVVNAATANGLVCVTAAGNGGSDQDLPSLAAPGDAFEVITCGAVAADGTLAEFSSNGPSYDGRVKPEVMARGVSTATVDPRTTTAYETPDGTSMSTPLVASAVALLLQAHPTWTVPQIRSALFQTSDYFVAHNTFDPNYQRGYGVININNARQISPCPWSAECLADMNCDGAANLNDVALFVTALLDPSSYHTLAPACRLPRADLNSDGLENGRDIELFVRCLLGSCP